MKLVTFSQFGDTRPGLLTPAGVVDLAGLGFPAGANGDLMGIAEGGAALLDELRRAKSADDKAIPLGHLRLHAPIFAPRKIVGVGLNYVDHCHEASLPIPAFPVLFGKFSSSVIGPDSDIVFDPNVTKEVDFEAELGVVIGKRASGVSEEDALDHVLGYSIVNDVSARDLQFRGAAQWDHGKSLDTFCPWGPAIVTADEIGDPQALDVRLLLNGREMQNSNTRNMIFSVARLIAFISKSITLEPGDLIATGTPFGVGFGRKPPIYLKNGDECVVEISRIGTLRNLVREAR